MTYKMKTIIWHNDIYQNESYDDTLSYDQMTYKMKTNDFYVWVTLKKASFEWYFSYDSYICKPQILVLLLTIYIIVSCYFRNDIHT